MSTADDDNNELNDTSERDDSNDTAALLRELLPDAEAEPASSSDNELSFWHGAATTGAPTASPPPAQSPAGPVPSALAVGPTTEPDDRVSVTTEASTNSGRRSGVLLGVLLGLGIAGCLAIATTLLAGNGDGGEATTVGSSVETSAPADTTTGEAPTSTAGPTTTAGDTVVGTSGAGDGVDPLTGEPFPATIGDLLYSEVVAGGYPHAVVRSDGAVVLRGRVPSEFIRQAGGAATAAVVGEDRVINEYTVEPNIPVYLDSRLFLEEVVLFEFNSTEIDPQFTLILDLAARALDISPTATITVVAFADSVGSEEVNLLISRERAQSVIDYWVEGGADPERFEIDARGESLASGAEGDEAAAFDRRVEFVFRDFVMVPTG